jgi:hypothetical protein
MRQKCWWESTHDTFRCAVLGCPNTARFTCHAHREEGYYCKPHRSEHRERIARRDAELDSLPREHFIQELARTIGFVEDCEDSPKVMSERLEGARLV